MNFLESRLGSSPLRSGTVRMVLGVAALLAVITLITVLVVRVVARRRQEAPVAKALGPWPFGAVASSRGQDSVATAAAAAAPSRTAPLDLLPPDAVRALGDTYTVTFFVLLSPAVAAPPPPSVDGAYASGGASTGYGSTPAEAGVLLAVPGAFTVSPDASRETLRLSFTQYSSVAGGGADVTIVLRGVTVARWHAVGVAVTGRTVDCYLDGELQRSVELPALPQSRPSALLLFKDAGGASSAGGYVALAAAWPRRLPTPEVAALYAADTDARGAPRVPDPNAQSVQSVRLCAGAECASIYGSSPPGDALTHVDWPYA